MLHHLTRFLVALTCALVTVPAVASGPAQAAGTLAVTAPAANAVWYTGETKSITWTVGAETGAYTLELHSASAKVATIGTGTDITAGQFSWTIPRSVAAIKAEDLTVRIVPAAATAANSSSFDLRGSTVTGVTSCRDNFQVEYQQVFCLHGGNPVTWFPAGLSQIVFWGRAGEIRGPVKIELLRTVNGATTATVLVKSTADDGTEVVTIPAKTATEADDANTYQWRVTDLTTGSSATSRTFSVIPNRIVGFGPMVGGGDGLQPFTVAAGTPVEMYVSRQERDTGVTHTYKLEAKPTEGKPVVFFTGSQMGPELAWVPPSAGTYRIVATDLTSKATYTTQAITVTASTEVVRQAAPSDTTATSGQPITLSWAFYDSDADTEANETFPGVDINVVSATGKVTNIAKAVTGYWKTDGMGPEFETGKFVWRPSAALAAGSYTVKVNRTGSTTTSDQTVTIAAATALTVDTLSNASAQPGEKVAVSWTATDDAELPVDISLVPSSGKPVVLAKKLVAAGNTTTVVIPAATPAGSYSLTVATVDKFGTAKTPLSGTASFTVTAPTLTVTATASVAVGGDLTVGWSYADDSTLPVKLELYTSGGKVASVISKSGKTASDGTGSITWTVSPKVAAGTDYVVKATPIGPKGATPASSSAVTITTPTITVSDTPTTGGVTVDQTVTLTWTSGTGVDQSVTVSLVKGTKVVAKLDAKALTVNGSGSYKWIVGSKLVPGTDYSIQVTDNANKTVTSTSAAFAVRANTTTTA